MQKSGSRSVWGPVQWHLRNIFHFIIQPPSLLSSADWECAFFTGAQRCNYFLTHQEQRRAEERQEEQRRSRWGNEQWSLIMFYGNNYKNEKQKINRQKCLLLSKNGRLTVSLRRIKIPISCEKTIKRRQIFCQILDGWTLNPPAVSNVSLCSASRMLTNCNLCA